MALGPGTVFIKDSTLKGPNGDVFPLFFRVSNPSHHTRTLFGYPPGQPRIEQFGHQASTDPVLFAHLHKGPFKLVYKHPRNFYASLSSHIRPRTRKAD